MARFAKFNAAMDRIEVRMDEIGDEAVRSTPKTASFAALGLAAATRRFEKGRARSIAANTFIAGQQVRSRRRIGADFLLGTVEKVEGSTIILAGGRCFAASAFEAV